MCWRCCDQACGGVWRKMRSWRDPGSNFILVGLKGGGAIEEVDTTLRWWKHWYTGVLWSGVLHGVDHVLINI